MAMISPIIKGADILRDDSYILYVFIRHTQQKVSVHLAEEGNWPPTVGYLNTHLGISQMGPWEDTWHIIFSLSPLSKGRHYFQEWIEIQREDNYVDGLQSYLLTG